MSIEKVYGYLKNWNSAHIRIDSRPHLPAGEQLFKDGDWTQEYENAQEELDDRFPEPRIPEIDAHIFWDSNQGHDEVTRRSITGILTYVGRIIIWWTSRRQGAIETST